jgi:ubiquinone/menaquinone biosynthesis C-methylase UbiE
MRPLLLITVIFISSYLPARNASGVKPVEALREQDSAAQIAILENPQREAEQKPAQVIKALDLKSGETIADIGAGSGYFAFRLARHIGNYGRVFAVDIDPAMIRHMNRRIRDQKISNVVTVLAFPDDPLLADDSIDRFFICHSWHSIEDQAQYLERVKRMLKRGGQVVIIDYKMKASPTGMPQAKKAPKREVVKRLESSGFRLLREHDFLPQQYFLVFSLPGM